VSKKKPRIRKTITKKDPESIKKKTRRTTRRTSSTYIGLTENFSNRSSITIPYNTFHYAWINFKNELIIEYTKEIKELMKRERNKFTERLRSFINCTRHSNPSTNIKKSCYQRIACPSCSLIRALKRSEQIVKDCVRIPKLLNLSHLTFGFPYDKSDLSNFTTSGFRQRIQTARKFLSIFWSKILRKENPRMWDSIECSPHGYIHIHSLIYGKEYNTEEITERIQSINSSINDIKIQKLSPGFLSWFPDEEELYNHLSRTALYDNGGMFKKHYIRGWIDGNYKIEVPSPTLVARFQIASSGLNLTLCHKND